MKIRIKQCPDQLRWYASLVGQAVPYLGDMGNEWKSREPDGFINFVQYADGELVEDKTDSGSVGEYQGGSGFYGEY